MSNDEASNVFSSINSKFLSASVSGLYSNDDVLRGRPFRGCAILWRKSLNALLIKQFDSTSLRTNCRPNGSKFIFYNVYTPYENYCENTTEELMLSLNCIDNLIDEFPDV